DSDCLGGRHRRMALGAVSSSLPVPRVAAVHSVPSTLGFVSRRAEVRIAGRPNLDSPLNAISGDARSSGDYSLFGTVSLKSSERCSRSAKSTVTGSDLIAGAFPDDGTLALTLYLPGGTSLSTKCPF